MKTHMRANWQTRAVAVNEHRRGVGQAVERSRAHKELCLLQQTCRSSVPLQPVSAPTCVIIDFSQGDRNSAGLICID